LCLKIIFGRLIKRFHFVIVVNLAPIDTMEMVTLVWLKTIRSIVSNKTRDIL